MQVPVAVQTNAPYPHAVAELSLAIKLPSMLFAPLAPLGDESAGLTITVDHTDLAHVWNVLHTHPIVTDYHEE